MPEPVRVAGCCSGRGSIRFAGAFCNLFKAEIGLSRTEKAVLERGGPRVLRKSAISIVDLAL